MSKREECRKCGAKLKHDKTLDQYDPEYCSGKCRKEDGADPYVKSAEEKAAVVVEVKKKKDATLDDYKKGVPSNYARRFEPEKLNWSKNWMNDDELEQAGFRANRRPIPGDWDYEEKDTSLPEGALRTEPEMEELRQAKKDASEIAWPPRDETDWDWIRAQAGRLGIKIYGKKKEKLLSEIKEAENV